MPERVIITVTPKDKTNDFSLNVSGTNRVSITEISRDASAGTITIDVRGTSATPALHPSGDTIIEAKLDDKVCGSAKAIVIVPTTICGPCPSWAPSSSSGQSSMSSSSSSQSSTACGPPGSARVPQNMVLDATTSPAYFGPLAANQVKLATVWIDWMTIRVCDQFGKTLDAMYEGCCVEELDFGQWKNINQPMAANGTYQDPVFWPEQPTPGIVPRGGAAATAWPAAAPVPMRAGRHPFPQNIPVRICGHTVGAVVRTLWKNPPNCAWVVCPDGTIM